tara:strand:- start:2493 stop:3731 length:1239 start_codon:yes stop_codon:yes gene_type:complete
MNFFLVQDGEAAGPFAEGEVRSWLKSGKILPDTFATSEALGEWMPVSEILPEENALSAASPGLPTTLSTSIVDPAQTPNIAQPIESRDPHEDDLDLRRHAPEKEERIRSIIWLAVGILYLIAFIWPTKVGDEMGVVNLQFDRAIEHLTWVAIPLMIWPALAGFLLGIAGFMLKGRVRAGVAILISLLPILLVLLVGGAGFVNMMEALSALEGVDLTQEVGRSEVIEKSFAGLRGLIEMGAAMLLAIIILAGVFSTLYFTILLTPHVVRHFRPNSSRAYYLGLIGGVFLFLFQLMSIFLSLFSLYFGILFGLGIVMGLALQMASVIVGFTNTASRSAKFSAKRALLGLYLGLGGLLLILLTLLFVPLIQGDVQAILGMYIFKLFIWFTSAALVFPLGVMDLWLGKASDTPQNS